MMNINELEDDSQCPFCGKDIEVDDNICQKCGGERVRGYLSRLERKLVLTLRIILCILAGWIYYDNYPDPKNFLLGVFLFAISIFLALAIPQIIFKIKNKGKVMWKRRVFSM